MHDGSSGFAFVGLLALAGCSQAAGPENRVDATELTVATVSTSASREPMASAAASASAPAAAPAMPPELSIPNRTGTPGATTGTIACGQVRCEAPKQRCTLDEAVTAWSCVPSEAEPVGMEPVLVGCDDASDCAPDQRCCSQWHVMSTFSHACVPRGDPLECKREICLKDGAPCSKGTTCQFGTTGYGPDHAAVEGQCVPPKGPATCAGRQRCPADKPVCVRTDKGLECAAKDSPTYKSVPGDKRFECTLQSDCKGEEKCSFSFGEMPSEVETYCDRYSQAYRGTMVCDPRGPSPCGKDKECLAAMACKESNDGMPWLGTWNFK
jgi:hypothetical protein